MLQMQPITRGMNSFFSQMINSDMWGSKGEGGKRRVSASASQTGSVEAAQGAQRPHLQDTESQILSSQPAKQAGRIVCVCEIICVCVIKQIHSFCLKNDRTCCCVRERENVCACVVSRDEGKTQNHVREAER